MNVLALSFLFPNKAQPTYGVFVLNRLRAMRNFCHIKVIAPIQWYPFIHLIRRHIQPQPIPAHEQIDGFDVFHPHFPVIPRYLKWIDAVTYLLSVRSLAKRLADEEGFQFDIVDAHWTYPDIVAAYWLAKQRNKRFIVTVRGHEALYLEENTVRRRLVAHFLRKADRVIVLSDELRDKVVSLNVPHHKVRVVLNGVDSRQFKRLDQQECRTQLRLPGQAKVVLSVGRLAKGKGHQDVIRAVDRSGRTDLQLYIIGGVNPEDNFEGQLRALIAELGLRNVHIVTGVEHGTLPLWYNAADVFCLASKREGCPNVVLEALACGTPVVSTDVGAVRDFVAHGKSGYLADGPASLASWLNHSLERTWDRGAIAASMDSRSWEACGKQLQDIYRSLL